VAWSEAGWLVRPALAGEPRVPCCGRARRQPGCICSARAVQRLPLPGWRRVVAARWVLLLVGASVLGCGRTRTEEDPAAAALAARLAPLRQRLAAGPAAADAAYEMGLAFEEHQMGDSARAAYERCIAWSPRYVAAHLRLAGVYYRLGRLDEAIDAYRRTLELAPGTAAVWNNLGFVFKAKGALDSAAAAYRRAIALDSSFYEPYNNLAQLVRQQGRPAEAIPLLQRAIELEPAFAVAYVNLATLRRELGDVPGERAVVTGYLQRFGTQGMFGAYMRGRLAELDSAGTLAARPK